MLEPLLKANRAAIDGECESFAAFWGPIADAQVGDTARNKRANRSFARFAGAEHQDFAILEITKDFVRKIDRD